MRPYSWQVFVLTATLTAAAPGLSAQAPPIGPSAPVVPQEVVALLLRDQPGMPFALQFGPPPGFPLDVVPPGTNVMLAAVASFGTTVVGVAPSLTAADRAHEPARLATAGWIGYVPPFPRGFSSTTLYTASIQVCRASTFARIEYVDRPAGGSLVRVFLDQPQRECVPWPTPDLADGVPMLVAPAAATTAAGARGGGNAAGMQSQTLITSTLSVADVSAHYVAQLVTAGWTVESATAEPSKISTRLSGRSAQTGRAVVATLNVAQVDTGLSGGARTFSLSLQVIRTP